MQPVTAINKALNNASHNKALTSALWVASVAITVFTAVSLYNQYKMHKVLYQKALLDIENYKKLGVTLPASAPK